MDQGRDLDQNRPERTGNTRCSAEGERLNSLQGSVKTK